MTRENIYIFHLDPGGSHHGSQSKEARRRQNPKRLACELHFVASAGGFSSVGVCGWALPVGSLQEKGRNVAGGKRTTGVAWGGRQKLGQCNGIHAGGHDIWRH